MNLTLKRPRTNDKLEALRGVDLFAACSPAQVEVLARQTDEIEVPRGTVLITKGKPSHAFYVLLEGEAEARISPERTVTMEPRNFFGEISMLDRGPATATVVANTRLRVLVMSHQQFRDAIKADPQI
ncbi:MAG: family transcriptional regulator, cyclic receptor protein, partial [Chloroflexota bacterium]|nr:family transcriptional regulator, cyclic receptor protein [Chloroflexota bacterium]